LNHSKIETGVEICDEIASQGDDTLKDSQIKEETNLQNVDSETVSE
jgi:hypothetical protein